MYKYSGFMTNFKQGNGEIHPVKISNARKKFGSLGYMWIVSFNNGTSHYMDSKTIFDATGVDVTLKSWEYNKKNLPFKI